MKNALGNLIHILVLFSLILLISIFATPTASNSMIASAEASELYQLDLNLSELVIESHQVRVNHARELLGTRYMRSVVRRGEQITNMNAQILAWTVEHLPENY